MTTKEIKIKSKKALKGNMRLSVSVIMAQAGINALCIFCVFLPYVFACGTLRMGVKEFFDRLSRNKKPSINVMFNGFHNYPRNLCLSLLRGLIIAVWSMLLFVPGIIVDLGYGQSDYMATEKPKQKSAELLKSAREQMNGKKWGYFKFKLSFLGWFLLCPLTLGVLYLFVLPYYHTAKAIYFKNLSKENVEETYNPNKK